MSTVLVTGAGGFVGSAVVRRLVERGCRLWDGTAVEHVAATLRPGGSAERLETLPADERWSIDELDLEHDASLLDLLRRTRPRAVIHTAIDAAVHDGRDPGNRVLETIFASLAGDDARVIHTSSAWVLAPGERLAEDAPLDPRSPYARHKAAQDALLPALGERSGVPWIALRLFNVFGRYEKRSRLVPYLVERLSRGEVASLSHGAQTRDFNDVDDVAEAFLLALSAGEDACDALYHVGTGRSVTTRDVALQVGDMLGRADLIRFGVLTTADEHVPALVADPSRARQALGWRSEAELEERVHAAVEWWLSRLPSRAGRRPEEVSR